MLNLYLLFENYYEAQESCDTVVFSWQREAPVPLFQQVQEGLLDAKW